MRRRSHVPAKKAREERPSTREAILAQSGFGGCSTTVDVDVFMRRRRRGRRKRRRRRAGGRRGRRLCQAMFDALTDGTPG